MICLVNFILLLYINPITTSPVILFLLVRIQRPKLSDWSRNTEQFTNQAKLWRLYGFTFIVRLRPVVPTSVSTGHFPTRSSSFLLTMDRKWMKKLTNKIMAKFSISYLLYHFPQPFLSVYLQLKLQALWGRNN